MLIAPELGSGNTPSGTNDLAAPNGGHSLCLPYCVFSPSQFPYLFNYTILFFVCQPFYTTSCEFYRYSGGNCTFVIILLTSFTPTILQKYCFPSLEPSHIRKAFLAFCMYKRLISASSSAESVIPVAGSTPRQEKKTASA